MSIANRSTRGEMFYTRLSSLISVFVERLQAAAITRSFPVGNVRQLPAGQKDRRSGRRGSSEVVAAAVLMRLLIIVHRWRRVVGATAALCTRHGGVGRAREIVQHWIVDFAWAS